MIEPAIVFLPSSGDGGLGARKRSHLRRPYGFDKIFAED
ncbi:hypothetical protein TRIP_E50041 [uncultured Spirochaetota bacterium]|uniref:Uncharacterized protein n=1 Tax=uncultured Spirochaetota bacterium TaxID=460511 RepID=A0A652ZZ09_9SPIR|nr:hypothetical protein TRIP_E50041 [uncultured Spirochaetota bacterium]